MTVEKRMGDVETAVEVLRSDVANLQKSENAAAGDRLRMHGKLDAIRGAVDKRDGAEKVRRGVRQWCWDLIKVGIGAVLGWFSRGGPGGG